MYMYLYIYVHIGFVPVLIFSNRHLLWIDYL